MGDVHFTLGAIPNRYPDLVQRAAVLYPLYPNRARNAHSVDSIREMTSSLIDRWRARIGALTDAGWMQDGAYDQAHTILYARNCRPTFALNRPSTRPCRRRSVCRAARSGSVGRVRCWPWRQVFSWRCGWARGSSRPESDNTRLRSARALEARLPPTCRQAKRLPARGKSSMSPRASKGRGLRSICPRWSETISTNNGFGACPRPSRRMLCKP